MTSAMLKTADGGSRKIPAAAKHVRSEADDGVRYGRGVAPNRRDADQTASFVGKEARWTAVALPSRFAIVTRITFSPALSIAKMRICGDVSAEQGD
jgi:hypothetical protein